MTASELLRRAKALIADERNWWDGKTARHSVTKKRCALNALAYFEATTSSNVRHQAGFYMEEVTDGWIAHFNDTHTHPEVLAAFDRAIALAERQGAA